MKEVKFIFILAGVFLLAAIGFLYAFFFIPESKKVAGTSASEQTMADVPAGVIEAVKDGDDFKESISDALRAEAESEIQRFKESYGMDISYDEMIRQLKVRNEYERMYKTSYELESVFLITTDDTEGDAGACIAGDAEDTEKYEENITAEKIRRYVLLYDVDEARYEGMTNTEKLNALEVEYGPLLEGQGTEAGDGAAENNREE